MGGGSGQLKTLGARSKPRPKEEGARRVMREQEKLIEAAKEKDAGLLKAAFDKAAADRAAANKAAADSAAVEAKPLEPIGQQMANATPAMGGMSAGMSGQPAPIALSGSPKTTIGSTLGYGVVPPSVAASASAQPANQMAASANQMAPGVSQFMVPSLSGLKFGGS